MEESAAEMLVHDHEELLSLLEGLRLALKKQDVDSGFQLLDLFWARLAMHIRAEHLHLFPIILAAVESRRAPDWPTGREVKAAIETLRDDHNFFMERLAESIKKFRPLMAQKSLPPGVADSVRNEIEAVAERLIQHNQLEEEQVYQWTALLLTSFELVSLHTSMERELNNMPLRFKKG